MNMQLQISHSQLVSDVQKEFNREFPYLKLEFFNKKALTSGDYSAIHLVTGNRKIGDIQVKSMDGKIEINGEMKVRAVETLLKEELNLAAQVFRKSGNLWLETTMTDSWTLNQQSNHAKELSTDEDFTIKASDYDLNRDADH